MAERKRSAAWTFFTAAERDTAICHMCQKSIRHCGNTTNLFKHIKIVHPKEHSELQKRLKKETEDPQPKTRPSTQRQSSGRGFSAKNQENSGGCSPTKPPSVLVSCAYDGTDATTSGHNAAPILVMSFKTRDRWASDLDLDAMDLDQLKREKLKMQLKVLKLQDEYYTLKIQELKK